MAALTTADLDLHAAFGVDAPMLEAAQVRRVDHHEALDLGFRCGAAAELAGVVYPYLHPRTNFPTAARLRRDHPEIEDGKPRRKYLSSSGDRRHLFFPPGVDGLLDDVYSTVVLVEAEKSALAITAAARRCGSRILAVALGGCWGWRGRIGKAVTADGARVDEMGPLPDFQVVTWQRRDVVILFDANATGNPAVRSARRGLAAFLEGMGARVRIGATPVEPGVNGPDDYRARHDDAALLALIDSADASRPPTVGEVIEESGLAAVTTGSDPSELESALRRAGEAAGSMDVLQRRLLREGLMRRLKELGVTSVAGIVDAALALHLPEAPEEGTIVREEPAWPTPVDGAALLREIEQIIRRYVVLGTNESYAIALWLVHSYAMDAWNVSPLLLVTSPTKRCGKTSLLEVVHLLCFRPISAGNMSTAVLFRVVDKYHPTLLLDEGDTWLKDERSELRGVVNSSYRRTGAHVWRCSGEEQQERCFSTWGAKLVAMIGKPADTICDRSIIIELRRKPAGGARTRLRVDRLEVDLGPLRQQIRRWVFDHLDGLQAADPQVPTVLNDRAADNWGPLLAIADAIGVDSAERARSAATALCQVADADDANSMLLLDVRDVFAEQGDPDLIPSADLVAALVAKAERPWAEFARGRPLSANKMARMLSNFGIKPADIRFGSTVLKGYSRASFADSWQRYVSVEDHDPRQRNIATPPYQASAVAMLSLAPDEAIGPLWGACCDVADGSEGVPLVEDVVDL